MKSCLLIGGPSDGRRVEVDDDNVGEELHMEEEVMRDARADPLALYSQDLPTVRATYLRETIKVRGSRDIHIYVIQGMTLIEALNLLFDRYPETDA